MLAHYYIERLWNAATVLSAFTCLLATCPAQAQQTVYIDPNSYGGRLGYSFHLLDENDGMQDGMAHVGDMGIEGPVVEAFLGLRQGIAVNDGLYFDMELGSASGKSLPSASGAATDKSSLLVGGNVGYQFLLGYRTRFFAAFGGMKADWSLTAGSNFPFMVRGELPVFTDKRIIASAWTDFKTNGLTGVKGMFPLGKRIWLYGGFSSKIQGQSFRAGFEFGRLYD